MESNRRTMIVIVCVGVVARLATAILMGDTIVVLPGIADQVSYDALGRSVADGHGFTFPANWWPGIPAHVETAFWSFGYSSYLAGVYAMFGHTPLVARLLQALAAGVLQPWLTYRLGQRIFGPRVGFVAAALTAVYAYFVYYAAALMTETFYIVAVLWALDLVLEIGGVGAAAADHQMPRATASRWLLLGMALGVAALLRQVILLTLPVLFAWLVWMSVRSQPAMTASGRLSAVRSVVTGALISGAMMLALILPWTMRNYQNFGRFVLLNTNAGSTVFWTNHPSFGTEFPTDLPNDVYRNLIPTELRGLDEAALDVALRERALGFVMDDPVRYVRLSLSRAKEYFKFWPSPDSAAVSNAVRVLSFGALLPFMLVGLVIAWLRHRRDAAAPSRAALLLLYGFAASYAIIHLLSWASIRYRLPIDAILLLFAAHAIVELRVWSSGWLQAATGSPVLVQDWRPSKD